MVKHQYLFSLVGMDASKAILAEMCSEMHYIVLYLPKLEQCRADPSHIIENAGY